MILTLEKQSVRQASLWESPPAYQISALCKAIFKCAGIACWYTPHSLINLHQHRKVNCVVPESCLGIHCCYRVWRIRGGGRGGAVFSRWKSPLWARVREMDVKAECSWRGWEQLTFLCTASAQWWDSCAIASFQHQCPTEVPEPVVSVLETALFLRVSEIQPFFFFLMSLSFILGRRNVSITWRDCYKEKL